jgi:predicted O-methyltransferase YrrM
LVNLPLDIERYFPFARRVPSFNPRVNHIGREDRRRPNVGFVTWDEGTYLMNIGLLFPGGRCLEIGTGMGWSTVCIALSGIYVDTIDPGLGPGWQGDSVRASLRAAGVSERVNLVNSTSPDAVHALGKQGVRWSFCFIDGDHEGDAPKRDLEACVEYLTSTAIIVCHDAMLPNVYKAIKMLSEQGWNVTFLQTAMGLGVAWRGEISPPSHVPDPTANWDWVGLYRFP